MKKLFHKQIKKLRFQKADFTEMTEELANPARGWYQIHTFLAEEDPDLEERVWCLHPGDTLVLLLIDIGAFRNRDLDEVVLDRISRIFSFFAGKSYDCIVRIVYDHEGKAIQKEPTLFSQVCSHMEQLGRVLKQFETSVFVFQGMLVGNWGEMHGSRFLTEEKLQQMTKILRSSKGAKTYLAVRRPVYWRMLHEVPERMAACADDMGLFDDGMFGSESDLGSFGEKDRKYTAWNSPWRREDELAFENEICHRVPNGGEAVYNQQYMQSLTPLKIIEDLAQMQITYLNRDYDPAILEAWKRQKYTGPGIWKGKSVYDYISAHLGYRFLIRRAQIAGRKTEGQSNWIEIEIENIGFAAFYQEAEIYLESILEGGECISFPLKCQMKGWRSKERRKLICTIEAKEGEMFLAIRRTADGTVIRFANQSDLDGRAKLGVMHKVDTC